jgi:SAM-dependent methyltransferase
MWPVAVLAIPLLVFISVVWPRLCGAPWVPTPMHVVQQMMIMADVGPNDVVYDLGCGDGRTIVTAARHYGARAVGVEIDPLRYLWCQVLIAVLGLRDRVQVVYGDLFALDLREADVVTCYLLQDTNNKLERKLQQELHPGTRVVSNTFVFHHLRLVRFNAAANLYLYNLR